MVRDPSIVTCSDLLLDPFPQAEGRQFETCFDPYRRQPLAERTESSTGWSGAGRERSAASAPPSPSRPGRSSIRAAGGAPPQGLRQARPVRRQQWLIVASRGLLLKLVVQVLEHVRQRAALHSQPRQSRGGGLIAALLAVALLAVGRGWVYPLVLYPLVCVRYPLDEKISTPRLGAF